MTILEVMLYLVVVGTLVSVMATFGWNILQNFQQSSHTAEVQRTIRQLDLILGDLFAEATDVTTPAPGASGSSLSLVLSDGSRSPAVISRVGTVLRLTEGATPVMDLHGSQIQVTALTVTNVAQSGTKDMVKIDMTLQHTTGSGNPDTVARTQKSVTYHYAIP